MVSPSSLCASCGRDGLVVRACATLGPGRFCSSCSERARARPCAACGTIRPPRRRANGKVICGSCAARQDAVARRDHKRRAVLDAVAQIETDLPADVIAAAVEVACDTTWRLTKVADALGADPGCLVSGRFAHPVEMNRLVVALQDSGATRIAGFVCERCGHPGRCRAVAGGKAICQSCSPKRRAVCTRCARSATVAVVWATGPVCSTCYQRVLASKGTCEGCGQQRRIDPRHGVRALCSDCAGLPPLAVCEGCGGEDRIWRNRRCFACNLVGRLDQLLARPDGGTAADLAGLRTAVMGADSPRQMLRWLANPRVESTLVAMAAGEIPVSHEQLDSLGARPWVDHLRHVLVSAGVLTARDEALARLGAWVETRLEELTGEDRKQVATFATWWVLHRRRARAGHKAVGSVDHAHHVINAAIGLLGWLGAHDKALGETTQRDIDLFLASGPPSRRQAREFLRWARRHRLCGALDIARRPDPLPVPTADLSELSRIARQLLVDEDVALVERVAGLLAICYAQPATRIVELTVDRIVQRGDTTTLRLGDTDIEVADTFGVLLLRLAEQRRGYAAIHTPDARWLFPGARPGRPLNAKQLAARLGRLGINLRAARTTVLLDYAGELAPAVIADMLGLNPSTAVRWVKAASGDWNAYAAMRAHSG